MNAERLNSVAIALVTELRDTTQIAILTRLDAALTRLSSSPQDQASQNSVASERSAIREALVDAKSNDATPGTRQTLEELGALPQIGSGLLERVNAAIDSNEITPASAQAEIASILAEQQDFQEQLVALVNSLSHFDIGFEELAPGEVELAVLIPRHAVDNEFRSLGNEFVALDKIFVPFTELTGENRPPIKVRSISSSDFMVFLDTAIDAVRIAGEVTSLLIIAYKSIAKIREHVSNLREEDVPEEDLAPIVESANQKMSATIGELVETLIDDATNLSPDRTNEVRTELTLSLRGIAERLDDGYQIDIRVGLPETSNEEEEEAELENAEVLRQIDELRTGLQFLRLQGDPILAFPPLDGDETVEDEGDEASS